jgi:DNA-binding transcriptional LysR family regulator
VADSARRLMPRTVGLLFGQDTLTVPDSFSKYAYQIAGFGFGYLPEVYARAAIDAGRLVHKQVEEKRADEELHLAWRSDDDGAALAWWIARMRRPGCLHRMFEHTAKIHFGAGAVPTTAPAPRSSRRRT